MIAKFDGLDYHFFIKDKPELDRLLGGILTCQIIDFETSVDIDRKASMQYWENRNPEGVFLRQEPSKDVSVFVGFDAYILLTEGRPIFTTYDRTDNKVRIIPPKRLS